MWVDSLCIIQDSKEDWQDESAKVDSTYSNAWCNISATKAKDSSGGCFIERDLFDVVPCTVDANIKGPMSVKGLHYCWYPNFWSDSIEKSKLLTRGRAQQERILSTRVLHFAKNQVFWECLELSACETFLRWIPANYFQTSKPSLNPHSLRDSNYKHADPARIRCALWKGIVDMYSGCELSRPQNDKLIAISGIARRIGMSDNYLAGLWKDFLPEQLMWRANPGHEGRPPSRPSQYRAPSWSWASIDGRVSMSRQFGDKIKESQIIIDIIRAETTPTTQDGFGQVQSGFIQL